MKVNVNYCGVNYPVECKSDDTVEQLLLSFCNAAGIELDTMSKSNDCYPLKLVSAGKDLDLKQTLESYSIGDNAAMTISRALLHTRYGARREMTIQCTKSRITLFYIFMPREKVDSFKQTLSASLNIDVKNIHVWFDGQELNGDANLYTLIKGDQFKLISFEVDVEVAKLPNSIDISIEGQSKQAAKVVYNENAEAKPFVSPQKGLSSWWPYILAGGSVGLLVGGVNVGVLFITTSLTSDIMPVEAVYAIIGITPVFIGTISGISFANSNTQRNH